MDREKLVYPSVYVQLPFSDQGVAEIEQGKLLEKKISQVMQN